MRAESVAGIYYRIKTIGEAPFRKRTPISLIAGAVAADMWLKGYSLTKIDAQVRKMFAQFYKKDAA